MQKELFLGSSVHTSDWRDENLHLLSYKSMGFLGLGREISHCHLILIMDGINPKVQLWSLFKIANRCRWCSELTLLCSKALRIKYLEKERNWIHKNLYLSCQSNYWEEWEKCWFPIPVLTTFSVTGTSTDHSMRWLQQSRLCTVSKWSRLLDNQLQG